MNRSEKARRVAILCCHCARNAAYYRAGWQPNIRLKNDFWVSVNGNFLDLMALDWCKLFTDRGGKHHWRKVAPDIDGFLPGLRDAVNATSEEFDFCQAEMKTYRDKFVAHLDNEPEMKIPKLTMAIESLFYLYASVRNEYADDLADAPATLRHYYRTRVAYGKAFYPQ